MSTEIATREEQNLETRTLPADASMLSIIAEAARDPRVDVDKMERLLAMKEREDAKVAERAFTEAMNRVKPLLPRIKKNGVIQLNKGGSLAYAKYEDIHAAVMPLLHENGFTVSYSSELAGQGLLKVVVTVKHKAGHKETGEAFVPLVDDSGAKNKVQGHGSTLSYGKRYALCDYLDIVTEGQDTDGAFVSTEPINEHQTNVILRLLSATRSPEAAFLKYMKVDCVADIMQRDYKKAVTALEDKLGKMEVPA